MPVTPASLSDPLAGKVCLHGFKFQSLLSFKKFLPLMCHSAGGELRAGSVQR